MSSPKRKYKNSKHSKQDDTDIGKENGAHETDGPNKNKETEVTNEIDAIGGKENGAHYTDGPSENKETDVTDEIDAIDGKENGAHETDGPNENKESDELDSIIDELDTSFFPQEMLIEEKRLKEEHDTSAKDSDASSDSSLEELDELDEDDRKIRYDQLLKLLEKSNKISTMLDNRIKMYKKQLVKKEITQIKAMKENVMEKEVKSNDNSNDPSKEVKSTNTSTSPSNKDLNEEEFYLNLFKQPRLFNGSLKTHQIEGLLWIRTLYENGLNGILADDMGLGKTIQTIAFYCFLIEMGIPGPFLVIAPLSTIPNWLSEFVKFAPDLSTLLYHGPAHERNVIRSKFKSTTFTNKLRCYPVIITTYEVVRVDIAALKNIDWKYITVDEGHKLKNIKASISKCMRLFNNTNILILTGTPIQNDMSELWSLLNLLMPILFDKLEDFSCWFTVEDFFSSNNKIVTMARKDEVLNILLKVLKPFILRREKKDTDLNLPPKKEIVIFAPITERQQELYKATLNKHMEILLNQKKETDNIIHGIVPKRKCVERIEKYTDHNAIMKVEPEQEVQSRNMAINVIMQNPFMQLKKIANHPYLVHMPLIPGKEKILVDENIVNVSGKFQVMDAMLSKLKLLGHKVLLFSTMTQILDIIEEFLIYRSYKYTRLDGTMQIQNRVEAMREFNVNPDCFLMIISTRAGGLGLNLATADTVIIFDSDWNPQCDLQAQDRCHRMGQTKPVVVYRFCSKNTVDEKILERAGAKRKLEKIIIGSGSFNRNTTKLDMSGIEELLHLLESSDYNKKIQSNGFIFTDEELDALLDRSDMIESASKTKPFKSGAHFKVLTNS